MPGTKKYKIKLKKKPQKPNNQTNPKPRLRGKGGESNQTQGHLSNSTRHGNSQVELQEKEIYDLLMQIKPSYIRQIWE